MARLRRDPAEDSDDPVGIPTRRRQRPLQSTAPTTTTRPARRKPQPNSDSEDSDVPARQLVPKVRTTPKDAKTQVRLAPAHGTNKLKDLATDQAPTRRTALRKQAPAEESSSTVPLQPLFIPSTSRYEEKGRQGQGAEEIEVEGSIWCGSIDGSGSSSDQDLPSLRQLLLSKKPPAEDAILSKKQPDLTLQLKALRIFDDDDDLIISKPPTTSKKLHDVLLPTSSSDKENDAATALTRPDLRSLHEHEPFERPQTPPQLLSPGKSKLKSPSKRLPRIPNPPLRPSVDAFWTAGAVNDWNDQYSPQKPLKSPRKLFFRPGSEETSPATSPRKQQSPFKRTKAEIDAKKDFEARKIALAESFLQELDQKITKGQVQELAQSTGGVKLVWSKTLNSTAGRANWRKETTKSKRSNGEVSTTHKHFASIELATKVIDDEHRLLNVIAHEFCHLANFMISGIKDQPHGRQFKEWGRLCTRAFGDRGVEVTTKHSYEIEYKYIWQCTSEECAMEFKRHSKSIDPTRHRCGGCKSNLVQIKPVPRKGARQAESSSEMPSSGGMGSKATATTVTGYAAYVKLNFASLKKSMSGASHKEVMEALGRKYRADKAAGTLGKSDFNYLADAVANDLGRVKLGGSDDLVVIDSD